MYSSFREEFNLPISRVFPYFESPAEWAKLYGVVKPTRQLANGWHSVPLKKSPFPLLARNVELEPLRKVRWIFGGFWRGVGEVSFEERNGKTTITGFEYITPHGLWILAPLFERLFMEKEFDRIWGLGWHRIRKNEGQAQAT